jgi:predicted transcriptional regulator
MAFMDDKRTMTFNLTVKEMEALERLAEKKEMTKTALLRHALRLFVLVEDRVSQGHKLFLEDEKSNKKAELMLP